MADEERYERGLAVMEKLWGSRRGLPPSPGDPENAKDLQRLITEHCFSDSWSRPGQELKTKSLLTIAILTTLGAGAELRGHVMGALNIGVTKEEIVEVFIHTAAYAGIPRTVAAFGIARDAFGASEKK
ncbi:MAG: carboxymuconolactone decarboxylase family protein [Chloroflexi bacterium]|nr:carboxymuconolactone decarboxylase family protein [Chloroflexota bacterium]